MARAPGDDDGREENAIETTDHEKDRALPWSRSCHCGCRAVPGDDTETFRSAV